MSTDERKQLLREALGHAKVEPGTTPAKDSAVPCCAHCMNKVGTWMAPLTTPQMQPSQPYPGIIYGNTTDNLLGNYNQGNYLGQPYQSINQFSTSLSTALNIKAQP